MLTPRPTLDASVDQILQRIVEHLNKRYRPKRIILFGSRAKGTARAGSDIDIAVDGIDLDDIRLRRILHEELDQLAGAYTVDLVDLSQVDEQFRQRIEETGIVLHEGS